jgi:NAD(P)-dependent dehydrogenase (short-subunit alcohol dehydrogenase family)
VRTDLRGRVVAITGGARGVGLAIGRACALAGARVALGDLDGDVAAEAAAQWGGPGLRLDVRDEASWTQFLDDVRERLGPIDVMVNSAGVALPGRFLDSSAGAQDVQLEVNLAGVVRCLRLVLPQMVHRGSGHVVNIASASGLMAAPGAAVYSATKHGVVGLTEAVRWELRGTGVHLTAVLPTVVSTEMAAGLGTRGLPTVSAANVADVVLRAVRSARPPAVVLVPRWFRAVQLIDALAPQWVRDRARRIVKLEIPAGNSDRQRYLARVQRQLDASAASEHDR